MSNTTTRPRAAASAAQQVQVQSIFSPGSAAAQQLVTGLGGAIGSDYRAAGHQLVFVEFSGKLSRLNLIPSATILSQGTVTIPGTWLFDFDTGTITDSGAEVWWRQMTSTERALTPQGGAEIVRLGAVNYNAISYPELLELAYGTTPIDGSVGAGNQLTAGTVFAVRTGNGNYAKAQVLSYGYDLQIRWTTYQLAPMYQVLGTGYDQPEDVKVAASETHAYVTERSGSLLRVELANAGRAFATVVSTGMTAPHQLVLDEPTNQAYVVEFAPAGRLLRIDLTSGAQTVLAAGLQNAIGLLLTHDRQFAYVSEQAGTGRVVRIRLDNGHREEVIGGLTAPFMMTWSDPGETGILIAERDPANRVTRIDLASAPATRTTVATTPFRPSSVAVVSPTRLLVCCDQTIAQLDLTSSVYTPAGTMLLGIGHVPADRISRSSPLNPATDGYADTSLDEGYFFPVKDAPFGGTLPVMFNHERAYAEGARYYKLEVDGVEPRQSFTDYRWSTSTNRFQAQAVNPTATGYYRVRAPSELWYHHWLGYLLNTRGLSNGLHVITIRLFETASGATEIGSGADAGRSVAVQIDNTVPLVAIEKIFHDGMEVNTCGLVTSGSDQFTFRITAQDPEQHMGSWSLIALWGDNKSKAVASDSYAAHASSTRKWAGPGGSDVPAPAWTATVPGDPSSRKCAHTFRLAASSRVIDGWHTLHHPVVYKSITLLLPDA
jgi:sugar lactone lactonase YvrE